MSTPKNLPDQKQNEPVPRGSVLDYKRRSVLDDFHKSEPTRIVDPKSAVQEVKRAGSLVLRKTKIVGTLGPSSWPLIEELVLAGVNVFRINFSHAEHDHTVQVIKAIRKASKKVNVSVAILADLCGPKVRTGLNKGGEDIPLVAGEDVLLRASDEPGEPGLITTKIDAVVAGLKPGQRVLLDDGTMRLEVKSRNSEKEIVCEVKVGGVLKQRKGINVPDMELGVSALTEKDKKDCLFALQHHVDYIALSFVQRKQDVMDLREFISESMPKISPQDEDFGMMHMYTPLIISKIEKPQALENIDSILEATDGIMVARGDLGVECDVAEVPLAQKMLISKTKELGKPVITATQMLDSMIEAPVPTRAEVSDVANAVFDGTDAVMLSGEMASGKYPVVTVQTMAKICLAAERDLRYQTKIPENRPYANANNRAIADAAVMACRSANAACVVYSESGKMVSRISQRKPPRRIIAVTHSPMASRRMALFWGVYSVVIPEVDYTTDSILLEAEKQIAMHGWLYDREPMVFVSGNHDALPGLHCTLRLTEFGAALRSAAAIGRWKKGLRLLKNLQTPASMAQTPDSAASGVTGPLRVPID